MDIKTVIEILTDPPFCQPEVLFYSSQGDSYSYRFIFFSNSLSIFLFVVQEKNACTFEGMRKAVHCRAMVCRRKNRCLLGTGEIGISGSLRVI